MALSIDSKVKEVRRSEEGKAIVEKYIPGFFDSPSVKLVGMMTLRKLFSFPEAGDYAKFIEPIDEELKALN